MDHPRTLPPARDPMRDGSRDGSAPSLVRPGACPVCSSGLPSTRARYCSAACKQRAFRLRQAAVAAPEAGALREQLRRVDHLVQQTVYQCPACDERFLGRRRCDDCNRFCRALGLGGACPECDHPIVLAELLGLEVTR